MILLELYNFLYKDIISGLEAPGSTRKLYKNPTDGVQVQGQKGESMKALVLHFYCLRLKEIKKNIVWMILDGPYTRYFKVATPCLRLLCHHVRDDISENQMKKGYKIIRSTKLFRHSRGSRHWLDLNSLLLNDN